MPLRRWFIAIVLFLLFSGTLILVVSHYYLLPAMTALETATPEEKKRLAAISLLVLLILLISLLSILLLMFRVGRYIFPTNTMPQTTTPYIDAWAESAKRMKTPPDEEDDKATR